MIKTTTTGGVLVALGKGFPVTHPTTEVAQVTGKPSRGDAVEVTGPNFAGLIQGVERGWRGACPTLPEPRKFSFAG